MAARAPSPGGRPPGPSPAATAAAEARAARLLSALSSVPPHTVGLRRAKYRVVRRVARTLGWATTDDEKDRGATLVWLDKWENGDLGNLRHFKVRRGLRGVWPWQAGGGSGGGACAVAVTRRRPGVCARAPRRRQRRRRRVDDSRALTRRVPPRRLGTLRA